VALANGKQDDLAASKVCFRTLNSLLRAFTNKITVVMPSPVGEGVTNAI
jgi:hypothetical protein